MADLHYTPLEDLAVLDLRGPDTLKFLQGQVSNDMLLLPARGRLLAGLHNAQGRVLALLRLLHLADDHVLAVVPADLAAAVRTTLAKFVLRARVKIEDAGAAWMVYGITGPDAAAAASTRLHMPMDEGQWRQMIVAPRSEPPPDTDPASRDSWRLDDISAGIPEVVAATSGLFIAQMLNLDRLDAISFSKGCYTGQEVVARAHYRGQVKRTMQRFFTHSQFPCMPGTRLALADGRRAQVVSAAAAEGGGHEFLAVTTPPGVPAAEATDGETAAQEGTRIDAAQLPLPYA